MSHQHALCRATPIVGECLKPGQTVLRDSLPQNGKVMGGTIGKNQAQRRSRSGSSSVPGHKAATYISLSQADPTILTTICSVSLGYRLFMLKAVPPHRRIVAGRARVSFNILSIAIGLASTIKERAALCSVHA